MLKILNLDRIKEIHGLPGWILILRSSASQPII